MVKLIEKNKYNKCLVDFHLKACLVAKVQLALIVARGAKPKEGQKKEIDNKKFYDLLGVDQKAPEADIKRAFRKKAIREHPDKGGDPEKVVHSIMLSSKNSHMLMKFSLMPTSANFTMNMVKKA